MICAICKQAMEEGGYCYDPIQVIDGKNYGIEFCDICHWVLCGKMMQQFFVERAVGVKQ